MIQMQTHKAITQTLPGLFDAAKEITDNQAVSVVDQVTLNPASESIWADGCMFGKLSVGDFFNDGPLTLIGVRHAGVTLVYVRVFLHTTVDEAAIITDRDASLEHQLRDAREYLRSAVRFNPSMFAYSAKIAAFGDNYLLPNENSEQIRSFWIVKNNHMYTYIYWK